jgi:hypothetical protein
MAQFTVLRSEQAVAWEDVLRRTLQHDFYHTSFYHALNECHGDGTAHLFVYTAEPYRIALPLLLRPLEHIPGLATAGGDWQDATSVYGYAGPVASDTELPASVLAGFRRALREALEDLRVVSVFSRLHPLLSQADWLTGLGECRKLGRTVSIDLTLSPEEQFRQYRTNRRWEINKIKRLGVCCREDTESRHTPEFLALYYDAMRRLGAADVYFFNPAYLEALVSHPDTHLFIALYEQKLISAGLVTMCKGIMQNHLTATHRDFVKLSPQKLLIDTARLWGTEQGLHVYHLGGGVGSREDDLFHYKTGFSKRRHAFQTWRWVVMPELYSRLWEARARHEERQGRQSVSPEFFPAYRAPTGPKEIVTV